MLVTTPLSGERVAPELALAQWTGSLKRSVLRQMLAVVSQPGIISFAGGLPAPELFPARAYAEAMQQVLAQDPRALQYGPPFEPLKEHIVRLMARRGVSCTAEQIFVTTGAQQGLNLAARLLLDDHAQVLVEQVVYTGIQQVLAPYRPQILGVKSDLDEGLDVAAVARYLQDGARPAFLYVIPEAHNPLGVSLATGRREELVDLARSYGLPIVEDDPYGFLYYDRLPPPALRSLDESWVIYVGSFSKILAPALRLGWMVIPQSLAPQLTVIKEAFDLETSALTQRCVAAYLDAGHLPAHLERLRAAYRERRDAMLTALERHLPEGARWTRPSGGMFVWVELPTHVDTTSLLWQSVEEARVAFIPGSAFAVPSGDGPGIAENCMRLNFSACAPEVIEDGITRLATIIRRAI
jgi:2-aminoadipate transaminase